MISSMENSAARSGGAASLHLEIRGNRRRCESNAVSKLLYDRCEMKILGGAKVFPPMIIPCRYRDHSAHHQSQRDTEFIVHREAKEKEVRNQCLAERDHCSGCQSRRPVTLSLTSGHEYDRKSK